MPTRNLSTSSGHSPIEVHRSGQYLRPDNSRVLLRPFMPGSPERAIRRLAALSDEEIAIQYKSVIGHCGGNHCGGDLIRAERTLDERFLELAQLVPTHALTSMARRRVIAAYFLSEFSLQSAALFNPSIVPALPSLRPHGDDRSLPFVMSLRATGEGHLSSIEFRGGIIDANGSLHFDPVSPLVTSPHMSHPVYRKLDFLLTLLEMGFDGPFVDAILAPLEEVFEMPDLENVLAHPEHWPCPAEIDEKPACEHYRESAVRAVRWAAQCDYVISFANADNLSERIIFPESPSERAGIEDARFVLFREDDGTSVYYATYTAFDGDNVMPQLIETEDFLRFRLHPFHGRSVRNKGMALFPRRIDGKYAMLGRQGGESITFMLSDDLRSWNDCEVILEPEEPWELMQIGNCGSPIETEAGWLVLTHGVGALRNYSIGAVLLDLDDPRKVIGRLREPLLEPLENERDGYVPNVVYTCGSIIHNGLLVIPFAVSDNAITSATVSLDQLLARLTSS